MIGDVIEVVAVDGTVVRIEIAPFNDGPAFLRALERARAAAPAPPVGDIAEEIVEGDQTS